MASALLVMRERRGRVHRSSRWAATPTHQRERAHFGLTDREIAAAHFEPVSDISHVLAGLLRQEPAARVCVLPEGPQTIAYIS